MSDLHDDRHDWESYDPGTVAVNTGSFYVCRNCGRIRTSTNWIAACERKIAKEQAAEHNRTKSKEDE